MQITYEGSALATITDDDERKAKLTERVKGMKKLFDAEVAKEVAKAKAEFLKQDIQRQELLL